MCVVGTGDEAWRAGEARVWAAAIRPTASREQPPAASRASSRAARCKRGWSAFAARRRGA